MSSCSRHSLVGETQFDTTLRRNSFGLDAELKCPAVAELPDEQPVETTVGHQRDGREWRQQEGIVRHDQEVALQRHRQTDSRRRSRHRSNDRLRNLGDRFEHRPVFRLQNLADIPINPRLEVRTRGKTATLARKDDDANRVILARPRKRLHHGRPQLRVEGIHGFRTVQSYHRHRIVLLVFDDIAQKELLKTYMLRRYSPPTSYRAPEIWPSELDFTVSINSANTLPRSRATACSRTNASRPASACVAWNART